MKQVIRINPDKTTEVYRNASVCARDMGVTIQTVSICCNTGGKCQGCDLRYLNPFTGEILEPSKKRNRPKHTGLEMARPVIETLCGEYADEAIAYIAKNHSDRFTYREIKVRFLQWHFKYQRLYIDSERWIAAWEMLEGKKTQ